VTTSIDPTSRQTWRHSPLNMILFPICGVISSRMCQLERYLARCALFMLAGLLAGVATAANATFLDPTAAFAMTARMSDPKTIEVHYVIADGYYMYRERFAFSADGARIGAPEIPTGEIHYDKTFEKNVETYRHQVTIRIPLEQAGGPFTLKATSQGCADAGLCYAPQDAVAKLSATAGSGIAIASAPVSAAGQLPSAAGTNGALQSSAAGTNGALPSSAAATDGVLQSSAAVTNGSPQSSAGADTNAALQSSAGANATSSAPGSAEGSSPAPANPASSGRLAQLLGGGQLLLIMPAFLLLGLGLAFTPCVLPMVPILSSIIVGEGAGAHRARAFLLSVAYSLGMALVYTALGIAAGLIGEGLAASLQNPWVLGAIGLLMVAMSLSMFGVYELQLPASLQTRLVGASGRQRSGKLFGVFVMGAISALIVGPCVAAPLAGALVYIGQTRNVVTGGAALFAMAAGMSIPLLIVGVSAGSLLPRAGAWMNGVKRFFGVLLLAVALWLVSPVLPPLLQMLLWAALLLGYGATLLRARGGWIAKLAGSALIVLGLVQAVGLATGGRDALSPLAHFGAGTTKLVFTRVKTVAQLDAALAQASGKTAMLDFYADWCVSCKEMEKLTFVDPAVQAKLAGTLLLQVDVTANDADDRALLKRFGLFGPPGIILFDRQGREIDNSRVIGYQNPATFTTSLAALR
jgi:thiol:disulfide interchange protein DsbD